MQIIRNAQIVANIDSSAATTTNQIKITKQQQKRKEYSSYQLEFSPFSSNQNEEFSCILKIRNGIRLNQMFLSTSLHNRIHCRNRIRNGRNRNAISQNEIHIVFILSKNNSRTIQQSDVLIQDRKSVV